MKHPITILGSIVAVLLVALLALIGGQGVLVADGGGDRSPDFEAPVYTVDGGGDRSPDFEGTSRGLMADGGGDLAPTMPPVDLDKIVVADGGNYAPDFEKAPILADGGGDYSPEFPSEGRSVNA